MFKHKVNKVYKCYIFAVNKKKNYVKMYTCRLVTLKVITFIILKPYKEQELNCQQFFRLS